MVCLNHEPYSLLISTSHHPPDEMIHSQSSRLLGLHDQMLRSHARLLDLHEDEEVADTLFSLAAFHEQQEEPLLLLTCAYRVGPGVGLYPGVLLVPETGLLLVGVGEQVFAYRLDVPAKLWQETAEGGFWGWRRYQDICLLSAELELAAWDIQGTKLWSIFVEPPWTFSLNDATIEIEVMGVRTSFPLREGPSIATP